MRSLLLAAACAAATAMPFGIESAQTQSEAAVSTFLLNYVQMKTATLRKEYSAAPTTAPVATKYGNVVGLAGVANGTVNAYLGIPFAQQPVGALRWVPPQPMQPFQGGTYNATWYQAGCYQSEWYWNLLGGTSEACLHLNIFTPSGPAPAEGWPVLFFMHVGSSEPV